jgi:hypothetical protein
MTIPGFSQDPLIKILRANKTKKIHNTNQRSTTYFLNFFFMDLFQIYQGISLEVVFALLTFFSYSRERFVTC